jgi:hypothetical protein
LSLYIQHAARQFVRHQCKESIHVRQKRKEAILKLTTRVPFYKG